MVDGDHVDGTYPLVRPSQVIAKRSGAHEPQRRVSACRSRRALFALFPEACRAFRDPGPPQVRLQAAALNDDRFLCFAVLLPRPPLGEKAPPLRHDWSGTLLLVPDNDISDLKTRLPVHHLDPLGVLWNMGILVTFCPRVEKHATRGVPLE